jgi:tetratricopeptide (TPR) repeat protein
LLSGSILSAILEFEPYTRSVFAKYLPESLAQQKISITWKEIEDTNRKLPLLCLLRFLMVKYLIPDYIEPEHLQDLIREVVKPRGQKELAFYNSKAFLKTSEDPNFTKMAYNPVEGEPQVFYHEFQLILGRIALYPSIATQDKNLTSLEKISDFFVERLGFAKPKEGLQAQEKGESDIEFEEEMFLDSDEYVTEADLDDPYRKMELLEQRRQEAMKKYHIEVNYEEIEKELSDLPPVPPIPEVKPSEPIPTKDLKVVQLGKVKARKKKKEEKKLPKPKINIRKPVLRRGEAPPKPIKFAPKPEPYPDATLKAVREYIKSSEEPVIKQCTKNKLCNSHVAACLIKEVYFPPEAPLQVATLIESANVYLSTEEYELAVSTFEEARETWKREFTGGSFKTEYELFFELSIANVLESAGHDEIALVKYISAKNVSSRGLPSHHPDVAIPYCGIASVLYHMEEYTLSLRAYLKAKEIREECIGGNTVDTATTYNNLGCCMLALARYKEANAYFLLSHAILQMELGPIHERTMTVALILTP